MPKKPSPPVARRPRRPVARLRKCHRCGCTDARACAGGCVWLNPSVDVCSACVRPGEIGLFATLGAFDYSLSCLLALPAAVRPVSYGRLNFELLAASSNLIARLNQREGELRP